MHFLTSCQLSHSRTFSTHPPGMTTANSKSELLGSSIPRRLPYQAIDIPSYREGVERPFQPLPPTQPQVYSISGALEYIEGRRLTEGASICSAVLTGMGVPSMLRWHTWGHLCSSSLKLLQISPENLLVYQAGLG